MSWRSQGITGSNNIPLGKRRFGGEDEEYPEDAPPPDNSNGNGELKRGRSPEPRTDADGPRRRKKRNRWGDASENKAAGLMGLTTAITANMTGEQLEAYTLHLRITEISQKLRIDDVVPADGDRCISLSSSAIRQPWSPYQHARIPLPQAPRRRAPQAHREGHEDHS
ncbi:hypothetical protein LZ30DRAFT_48707 [Colletotrichum cereale]|nr:hypothetical protein LZ30DRAFT_48707 [Colletotrichum cereale]